MKKFLIFSVLLLTLCFSLKAGDIYDDDSYVFGGHSNNNHRVTRTYLKPTQAYYGKDFHVYYGYTAVIRHYYDYDRDITRLYAFGYPIQDFNQVHPLLATPLGLGSYATFVFKDAAHAGSTPLEPIAEKPRH